MRLLFATLLSILICCGVTASETLSLTRYLKRANDAGIRVIFSSDLVPSFLQVTLPDDNTITVEQVREVVTSHGLMLSDSVSGTYVITRPAPESTDSAVRARRASKANPSIEEVVVRSSLHRMLMNQTAANSLMDSHDIETRPATGNDAVRIINKLPGTASDGISMKPRVRGGHQDETLFSFNGVRLYEPFHLAAFNSLYGTIDNRLIASMEFMSGGFPTNYGNRMSAVLEIETVPAADMAPIRELGIGLFTLSYLQAGSLNDNHYLVSVRRSTIDWVNKLSSVDIGTPAFADLFASYEWQSRDNSALSVNLLWYGDDASIKNTSDTESGETLYGNAYAWLDYQTDLGENWRSQTIASVAGIKNDRSGKVDKPFQVTGNLKDDQEFRIYSLQQTFGLAPDDRSELELGLAYRYQDAEFEHDSEIRIDLLFSGLTNHARPARLQYQDNQTGNQVGLFGRYQRAMTQQLFVEIGARIDGQDYIDGWTRQISPRINLLYRFNNGSEIRTSWGEFAQADDLHELRVSDGEFNYRKPQKSVQQVLSFTHNFDSGLRFRAEAYQKDGIDSADYYDNLANSVSLLPELKADRILVDVDDVTAHGVELSLEGYNDHFEWWLNYSNASVQDESNGQKNRRSWDQSHGANLGLSTQWHEWLVSTAATYHSGWRTTRLRLDPSGSVVAARRNSSHFGNFISVDVSMRRTWTRKSGRELRLEGGITNLLNRDNVVGTEYELEGGLLVSKEKTGLPIAPFVDLYWRF